MRSNTFNHVLPKSALAALALVLASAAAAQQQVNLTAGPADATLPDGSMVPMWGYACGAPVSGSSATCFALDPVASVGGWSPVVITVPTGQDLQINLTNGLSFLPSGGTVPNGVPTSLVLVGQVGGGLGSAATYAPSPTHAIQGTTWPIVGDTNGATFAPPPQGPRVQSFATEVAAGATASLCWGASCAAPTPALRPGTYLLESGTHPSIQGPMGLYGILVVTSAPSGSTAGTAYPGVSYAAEVPLLLSEIDPVQNAAVQAAVNTVGFSETAVNVLRDQLASVVLAVDASGNVVNAGTGYQVGDAVMISGGGGAGATAQVASVGSTGAILTVAVTNPGSGYSSTPTAIAVSTTGTGAVLSAGLVLGANTLAHCSDGANAVAACYPPAVNYTPLYYLVNGVAFDKSHATSSLFATAPATGVTGDVLVRLVNAGLRMHVPSVVGSTTGVGSTPGMSLVAEDGNPLPGVRRVQSEVFMAAGKTYDVVVNAPQPTTTASGTTPPPALPVYDRELSLSANSIGRDGGMLAYVGVNGGGVPAASAVAAAVARADTYAAVLPCAAAPCKAVTVSDPARGVIANDTNVYGVQVSTAPANGTLTLNKDGTFTYTPNAPTTCSATVCDTFTYQANGNPAVTAQVTMGPATLEAASGIALVDSTFTSNLATYLSVKSPGILAGATDGAGYALTVAAGTVAAGSTNGLGPCSATLTTNCVSVDQSGAFNASVAAPGTYTFTFKAQNSQGTVSASSATVTLVFPAPTGLKVAVLDGATKDPASPITDYRWIIEEDRTFYVDPGCTQNPLPAGCPTVTPQGTPAVFGTNFHTSFMPLVATGCTGPLSCASGQTLLGQPAVCDVGDGACRTDASQETPVDPGQVHLDPTKRYYLSVLPGDAANPFIAGYAGPPDCTAAGAAAGSCGHGMGGAPISRGQTSVTVLTQPSPYPPAKLTVFVFEDDFPLNGEHDAGGGVDVLSPNEPGLGGFQITLFDDAGGTGDATGQPTFDMFNMPLTNSLAGTIDPATGLDACPISPTVTANTTAGDGTQKGVIGMIVTCPTYESDGVTLSPLAGQAVVANLYQGRYGVVATPNADRIARGEEWLQTNTLDGQKAHDSFMRIGEPAYFQEFGPAGYHVTIGFANPKIINARRTNAQASGMCDPAPNGGGLACTNEVKGHVTTARMSRPPDERLYGSGTRDSFAFTQCYASLGDPDGADFAFVKCDDQGGFDFTGVPAGNWKLTIFDQWNDQIVDGISTPVGLTGGNQVVDLGENAVHQWQANVYTRTFLDGNGNGVSDKDSSGNDLEPGLALVSTNIRFRDGSFSNFNSTDLNGYAGFNEVFPLFSWYTIETDSTRYKTTGVHVVYDTGGPVDGSTPGGAACGTSTTNPCGSSTIGQNMANTYEANPLPADLSVPGAVYCAEGADCATSSTSFQGGTPIASSTSNHSSGRIDPPFWFGSYGWQGFSGQNSFLEFGKKPYVPGETGGIHGHVVYASTRPFDDPQLLLQLSWEPLVPHVRVNLYKEDVAADGITQTLTLIDHTETTSFDDWAQGFRSDGKPNMNCPGQSTTDLFFYSLQNQPEYLDWYGSQHGGSAVTPLPYASRYKCYDGMHNWNQLQPAPYDGMYSFPSVTALSPTTGKPAATNCTGCTTNPDSTDPYRFGAPMLPPGKYVVEVVVPQGYELVKEEDKNILIGDNFIAPVTQQFAGLGDIFILPDQAEVASQYNAYNAQNPTQNLGRAENLSSHEGDTGSVESFWPCVGAERVVPDYISLYPGSAEVSPFAGATRRLCDRKEITLTDQSAALAKFYVFTPTHAASHYTGVITDDFTSEFDPFSPQFGEKFAPAYLPVSVKDWAGNEISRVYSDEFGAYNGLSYSTWEVNPPNPTGYGPTMMVVCMNDSGQATPAPWWAPAGSTTTTTPDPLFQPAYSQFCYELPFMPAQTGYFDTPVVPTSAFSEGYNHPDCDYVDATPAVKEVDGDGVGPWVSASGHALRITALGDQLVDSYAYSGPASTTAPFNQQKVRRHYGFGGTPGTVTIGGAPATVTSWSDGAITVTVPAVMSSTNPKGVPACVVQQQAQYGGTPAYCGELAITTAAGKTSIDTVTVTIGGKAPTVLAAGQTIQSAIDAAAPGDLVVVPAGIHAEMLLMWKPIRLQGVGGASSVVDANPHPAGRLDPWRKEVNCLFGLTPDGRPAPTSSQTVCPAGMSYASGGPSFPTMIVDRVPMEGILGWDTTVNGNLAEQLIEPGLMGAYEGAAITVLGKGVNIPAGAADAWGSGAEAAFPTGTVLLGSGDCATGPGGQNLYPSNFYCNPSSVDGLGLVNSSQGGGGVFVHAWGHNVQIANNRIHNNTGTLSGGITIGQGEHIEVYLAGAATVIPPGSCEANRPHNVTNQGLPFCYDTHVNVHHNSVTLNNSIGDELFSSTPAGAGGVSINNGADYYTFANNWVCGNMSSGDGGGVAHIGFIKNGDIEHNAIIFNQSTNPTISTNGGGLLVMGAPDPDPLCSGNTDKDCVPDPASIPPSDGTGPDLVVNGNLLLGNAADSGSGGGLRLQHVNGTDVLNFPNGATWCPSVPETSLQPGAQAQPCQWNSVAVTNNIIADNVAGWDGAGVSLQDALAVNVVNNTIVSNDSTASAGVLFGSLFAPLASAPGTNCTANNGSQSCPQVAGLVSVTNSPVLQANLPAANLTPQQGGLVCPPLHGSSGSCRYVSVPALFNDMIWKNRSFFVGLTGFGTGTQDQQQLVALFNSFSGTPAASQPSTESWTTDGGGVVVTGGTGACTPGASYWDVGVRGDLGPTDHSSGFSLAPMYSWLTSTTGYDASNRATDPTVLSQYCNGSRVPPENGGLGYLVPPGTNETNALPTPVFSLTPSATVDEGNNWINMRWGPLDLTNPVNGDTLGNYGPAAGSPVIDYILPTYTNAYALAPSTDFYGNARKTQQNPNVDDGAVEFRSNRAIASVTGGPLKFGSVLVGGTSSPQTLTLHNGGGANLTGVGVSVTAPFARTTGTGSCGTSLAAGATCNVYVVFRPTAAGAFTGTATITASVPVDGSPVSLSGTGVTTLASTP